MCDNILRWSIFRYYIHLMLTCDASCKSCTGPNSDQCLTWYTDYFLKNKNTYVRDCGF